MSFWSSWQSLAKYQLVVIVCAALLGWILWQIRDIILLVFLSYIVMAALVPSAGWLERHHIPKVFAILGILVLIALIVGFFIVPFIEPLLVQVETLLFNFPSYVGDVGKVIHVHINIQQFQAFISSQINSVSQNAFSVVTNTFSVFFAVGTFFIVTFYLLMDHDIITESFLLLFPRSVQKSLRLLILEIEKTLGDWVRGQVVLSLAVGFLTWLVYLIVHLPFAIPLAVLAGFLEIVPTIGPLIAFIPAVILGFTVSPFTGIEVGVGYLVVQFLEGNFLVPKIMEHAVGLHPLAVILAVLVGARFFGVMGALLSVPFLAVMTVIYNRAVQK